MNIIKPEPSVTLSHTGYILRGEVLVELWDGSHGHHKMSETWLKKDFEISKDNLKPYINDGGFGCKLILNCEMNVRAEYGSMYERSLIDYYYDVSECIDGKRGI